SPPVTQWFSEPALSLVGVEFPTRDGAERGKDHLINGGLDDADVAVRIHELNAAGVEAAPAVLAVVRVARHRRAGVEVRAHVDVVDAQIGRAGLVQVERLSPERPA